MIRWCCGKGWWPEQRASAWRKWRLPNFLRTRRVLCLLASTSSPPVTAVCPALDPPTPGWSRSIYLTIRSRWRGKKGNDDATLRIKGFLYHRCCSVWDYYCFLQRLPALLWIFQTDLLIPNIQPSALSLFKSCIKERMGTKTQMFDVDDITFFEKSDKTGNWSYLWGSKHAFNGVVVIKVVMVKLKWKITDFLN